MPGRARDAARTRAALLAAAAELFAERGFDRTTVRQVAARAGVNQALLFRYFGSKEELFAEVLAAQGEELLAGPDETLVHRVLANMLEDNDSGRVPHALRALLRSAGHERAVELLRETLGREYGGRLSALTNEPDAALRADLVLAWLLGIGLLRTVLDKEPLASADPGHVRELVVRATRQLLEQVGRSAATETGD
ncbi:TetR family transcriptional regulator [Longimycelium tulufanense]|uniref:TetR family transcriptional regulator n=1 Tax=Longimycelium tulufanense TaxID=907463 RepID=A0A8J3C896_9PSEU|nr:TetR/AcrR family transcriptional regulator [Longimycelium tulufanense]GGM53417.1 TetR family transcriptional regulator [Longimycelium tulufanense]